MTTKEKLLLESKAWVQEKLILDKGYFQRLSAMHSPSILWIGSSDSLVPVKEITNTEPGEVLVYRNPGNQVKRADLSFMALLEDAVEISNIECIVVCGYSHCTSLREVINGTDKPFIREWLIELRALYQLYHKELDMLPFDQKERKLAEINIRQQIINLSKLDIIQNAWKKGTTPKLYGWYFDLDTGALSEVFSMEDQQLKQLSSLV
jgi:carbonic anhydrase